MNDDRDLLVDEIVINAKSAISVPEEELDDNSGKYLSNGSSSFSFTKRRRKMMTPEKRKELEDVYKTVIVHDYGDEYHMSEDERKRKFKYYEVFSRLLRCKRKYRKLDEFVRVCRLCLDCINLIAEDNGIYDPEKFKVLVMKGDIDVYGLNFPKYVGKDRKSINWEYISDFIMDESLDPKELSRDKFDEDDENDVPPEQLFSEDEWTDICNIIEKEDSTIHLPYYDGEMDNVPSVASKKQSKLLLKIEPQILTCVKNLKKEEMRSLQRNGIMNSMVYEMSADDFAEIANMDRKRDYFSESDIPEFNGDIMNDSDYIRYIYELNEYEKTQIKENYQGKMRTKSEINEMQLKDALESAGWNIRKLYKCNNKIRDKKKIMKKEKEREDKLKKKLINLQKRQNMRSKGKKDKMEFNVNSKKKKSGG